MEEIWKPIEGYEGLYEVSNLGRVKSLARFKKGKHNGLIQLSETIMKTNQSTSGYAQVSLTKDGKPKAFTIHRLVAKAFIPNPNNYPQVNHKDEVKTNNCVDNLEWCTPQYNYTYGNRITKAKETYLSTPKDSSKRVAASVLAHSKPIYSITISDRTINEYPSCNYAAKTLGYEQASINRCLLKKQKTSYGRYWYFKELQRTS